MTRYNDMLACDSTVFFTCTEMMATTSSGLAGRSNCSDSTDTLVTSESSSNKQKKGLGSGSVGSVVRPLHSFPRTIWRYRGGAIQREIGPKMTTDTAAAIFFRSASDCIDAKPTGEHHARQSRDASSISL